MCSPPITSTRACSKASYTSFASRRPGLREACRASSWWRRRSATLSAAPRSFAISACGRARVGSGRRARLPTRPLGPGWNATCTSGACAMARKAPAVARLKSSVREFSLEPLISSPYSPLRDASIPVGSSSLKQRW